MTIETVNKLMDSGKKVMYHGKPYKILGLNELNNTVTLAMGPIGKDVKVSELDEYLERYSCVPTKKPVARTGNKMCSRN